MGMPSYHTTKHAAVALSESVSYDLQAIGADIAVVYFFSGFVQTDLHHTERHRPEQYRDDSDHIIRVRSSSQDRRRQSM